MSTVCDDLLIEAAAGLLGRRPRRGRIRAEAEEEPAIACARCRRCSSLYEPGLGDGETDFFIAEYVPDMRSARVAHADEGETSRCWSCH